jgi:hypothetical protein
MWAAKKQEETRPTPRQYHRNGCTAQEIRAATTVAARRSSSRTLRGHMPPVLCTSPRRFLRSASTPVQGGIILCRPMAGAARRSGATWHPLRRVLKAMQHRRQLGGNRQGAWVNPARPDVGVDRDQHVHATQGMSRRGMARTQISPTETGLLKMPIRAFRRQPRSPPLLVRPPLPRKYQTHHEGLVLLQGHRPPSPRALRPGSSRSHSFR